MNEIYGGGPLAGGAISDRRWQVASWQVNAWGRWRMAEWLLSIRGAGRWRWQMALADGAWQVGQMAGGAGRLVR